MKIVLATGIYPPDIGGPATYVEKIAKQFVSKSHTVVVVTYAQSEKNISIQKSTSKTWTVVRVSKKGGPLLRWLRYKKALQQIATDADIVYAFSSVSAGIPLILSRLKTPKKVLRLGGDFFWERYTDMRGTKSLRQYYASAPWYIVFMQKILSSFDHIVFSTKFQQDIYIEFYKKLPAHSVIENALEFHGVQTQHIQHKPLRILFVGRLVAFKNLQKLIQAMQHVQDAILIIAGDGPEKNNLQKSVYQYELEGRVYFVGQINASERSKMFEDNDVLIIPSITEISPNTALEARSEGMPVILTKETGLSDTLTKGMYIADLSSASDIVDAIQNLRGSYARFSDQSSAMLPGRDWSQLAIEHEALFSSLL